MKATPASADDHQSYFHCLKPISWYWYRDFKSWFELIGKYSAVLVTDNGTNYKSGGQLMQNKHL